MTASVRQSVSVDTQALVLDHLCLASALARRFDGRGVELDDLQQVAHLALVKAARRYDPESGAFPPFATATITGELKRHFRDRAWMVRPPRRVQEIQSLMAAEHLPEVTSVNVVELADRIDVDPKDLTEAANARGCFHPDSIDDPNRSGREFAAYDDNLDLVTDWATVAKPLRELDAESRRLLHWRFVEELTQQAIADRLGISQMQVSRRLKQVLDGLRSHPALTAA